MSNLVYANEPRHGKIGFCICENKDAYHPRGNREADQRLCFRYTDSTIPSEISSLCCTARLVSDLVFSQRGSNNVILLENKADQQQLLQELHNWCEANRLEINTNKSKVMHFMNASKLRSNRRFHCGPKILETVTVWNIRPWI